MVSYNSNNTTAGHSINMLITWLEVLGSQNEMYITRTAKICYYSKWDFSKIDQLNLAE
ncbi:hypothetical protein NIES4103_67550 [Nostoc sp. NIES-4103]|nr:hypothetical protein NIES4103_67550 [Nostoc sp. NIES-4103]